MRKCSQPLTDLPTRLTTKDGPAQQGLLSLAWEWALDCRHQAAPRHARISIGPIAMGVWACGRRDLGDVFLGGAVQDSHLGLNDE